MAKEYVKQAVSSDGTRTISAQRGFSWQRFLFQWEWMLVLMLILPPLLGGQIMIWWSTVFVRIVSAVLAIFMTKLSNRIF